MYLYVWHVLVCMVCIVCIGMYLYVSVRMACIGMYGTYCMYWYVYVRMACIGMYGMYCVYWYILFNSKQYIPIHTHTYPYIPIHTKSKISIISTTKIRTHNYRIVRTIPNAVPTWPTISENSKVQLNTYTKLHADQIWIKTFWMDDMHQIKHNPTTWTWKQPPTPLEQYIP